LRCIWARFVLRYVGVVMSNVFFYSARMRF